MSHHNHPDHGRPFRPSPTGSNSHGCSSYWRQPEEVPPPDPFSHSIPHQVYNHALQDAWVPPAPGYGQPEGHREDIPPPVGGPGVSGPGGLQDPHRNMAYQRIVDYSSQPINPAYIFADVGLAQGIQTQVQPDTVVDQERFVHGIPTPNQPRPEDLRHLASRYWYHPAAQVGMVSVEEETTGQYKVVITLKTPIRF